MRMWGREVRGSWGLPGKVCRGVAGPWVRCSGAEPGLVPRGETEAASQVSGSWQAGGAEGKAGPEVGSGTHAPESGNRSTRAQHWGTATSLCSSRPPPDVTLSPWSGDNKCHQRRVLTYTIPISNPLGPKSASVVETQVGRAGPGRGGRAGR